MDARTYASRRLAPRWSIRWETRDGILVLFIRSAGPCYNNGLLGLASR